MQSLVAGEEQPLAFNFNDLVIFSIWFLVLLLLNGLAVFSIRRYYFSKPLALQTPLDHVNSDLALCFFFAMVVTSFSLLGYIYFGVFPRSMAMMTSYLATLAYNNVSFYLHASIVVRFQMFRNHDIFGSRFTDEETIVIVRAFCFLISNLLILIVLLAGDKLNYFQYLSIGTFDQGSPTRAALDTLWAGSAVATNIILYLYMKKISNSEQDEFVMDKVFSLFVLFLSTVFIVILTVIALLIDGRFKLGILVPPTIGTLIILLVALNKAKIRKIMIMPFVSLKIWFEKVISAALRSSRVDVA